MEARFQVRGTFSDFPFWPYLLVYLSDRSEILGIDSSQLDLPFWGGRFEVTLVGDEIKGVLTAYFFGDSVLKKRYPLSLFWSNTTSEILGKK